MTQHILQAHTEDDKRIMRRLFSVIAGFVIATAIMAVAVAIMAP